MPDAQTRQYLKEVRDHFNAAEDSEARTQLATNALQEILGKLILPGVFLSSKRLGDLNSE